MTKGTFIGTGNARSKREGSSMLEQPNEVSLLKWYYSDIERTGFALPEDTYANWVILAPDKGGFHYKTGEEEGYAKYGEIVLCPPEVKLVRHADHPLSFLYIEFVWLDAEKQPVRPGPSIPYGKITLHRINRFASTFACIREMGDTPANDRFAYKQHLLCDLLMLCALETNEAADMAALVDPLVKNAAVYMQKHAFEPLSLQLLAEQACISQSQFSRRFQTAMGLSPIVYLTGLRMRKARGLLIETELTLEQIAQQCGYQNGFYLSRVFTKTMKMSPSDYRRTHRV
ncbi:helix-turn-helix domain-containing protein [Paenibacillus sp. MBLB4367]|uniref:helix-turn-helix domain-containing protein n=1 Tax=Paenibacillus sp. MBLB4367 TaxID=3384767 RepID=UPI00390805FA